MHREAWLHTVDNSDHWERVDKSISKVNLLQYSDFVFRLTWLNSQNYQNRMRHPEYVTLARKAGFSVIMDRRNVDESR